MFYFYLNNDKLKGMSARVGAKRINVKLVCDMDFPSEFINDPTQTNVDLLLTEAMLEMIRKNDIKSKTANFVLENSKIPFREVFLPYAKPAVLLPIIQNEIFTDKKLAEQHTVDYIEIDRNVNEEKQSRLMISYIDNLIISNLKKCTREVGMFLKGIDIAQSALSKLIYFMRHNLPQYFVLVDYRTTTLSLYLFADSKHIFSLTKSIYSMPNEDFPNEMAFFINDFGSIVGEAIQFFKSKYEQFNFDTIFVTGDTAKYIPCEQQIADYLGLNIQVLAKPDNISGIDLHQFNEFSTLIGSMVKG